MGGVDGVLEDYRVAKRLREHYEGCFSDIRSAFKGFFEGYGYEELRRFVENVDDCISYLHGEIARIDEQIRPPCGGYCEGCSYREQCTYLEIAMELIQAAVEILYPVRCAAEDVASRKTPVEEEN